MIQVPGGLVFSSHIYFIALGLSSLACYWFLYRTFSRLRRARWVEDTPTSRIRSAAQGLVELCGRADGQGHDPLISPLAGQPCLWYRFRVEEYQGGERNQRWHTVEKGESDRPFVLRDDTGECWIMPKGAEVHPRLRKRWEGNRRWPLSHTTQTSILGSLLGRRYRYTEEYLQQEDLLYALGWFESRGGGGQIMDSQRVARKIISNWKADYPNLLARFDRNGDGQLDQQEWQQVQAAAASEAQRQTDNAAVQPPVNTLSKPAYKGLPFLLSDHHEEHLSRRLRRQSIGSMLGMLISGGIAGWLWLGFSGF
ncbi:MAG: GIDE domain-containing protein [Pseudomonas sp.]